MAEGAEDRTQAATPARLLRARNEGHAPVARELPVFAGLVAGVFALASCAGTQGQYFFEAMRNLLATAGNSSQSDQLIQPLWALVFSGLHVVFPVAAASAVAILGMNLVQMGFRPTLSIMHFDLSKISPATGLKRLFGAENAIGALKSVVKIAAIGGIMFSLVLSRREEIMTALVIGPSQIITMIGQMVFATAAAVLAVQGVIAAADFAWTRVRFQTSMKMSHTELKDETKDADGNPHVKARLKRMIAARGRQNLKTAMSRATVVITNPTHYAVALDYQQGQTEAPKIVAKGAGSLAARIREYARDGQVPIVSNPPLARALFKLELESEIPAEHYKAVAEIIAYVWRLSGRIAQDQRRL